MFPIRKAPNLTSVNLSTGKFQQRNGSYETFTLNECEKEDPGPHPYTIYYDEEVLLSRSHQKKKNLQLILTKWHLSLLVAIYGVELYLSTITTVNQLLNL